MPTFSYEDYAKRALAFDLQAVPRAVAEIRKTVKLRGPRIVQELITIDPKKPVDRGTYRRSFRFEDVPGGATAYNFAPHAPIVEYGRTPGAKMPPIDVIFDWVKRHHIGGTFVGPVQPRHGPEQQKAKGVRKRTDRGDAIERQQWGIALAIARKIKARGLPPHLILERASGMIDDAIHEAIDAGFRTDVAR